MAVRAALLNKEKSLSSFQLPTLLPLSNSQSRPTCQCFIRLQKENQLFTSTHPFQKWHSLRLAFSMPLPRQRQLPSISPRNLPQEWHPTGPALPNSALMVPQLQHYPALRSPPLTRSLDHSHLPPSSSSAIMVDTPHPFYSHIRTSLSHPPPLSDAPSKWQPDTTKEVKDVSHWLQQSYQANQFSLPYSTEYGSYGDDSMEESCGWMTPSALGFYPGWDTKVPMNFNQLFSGVTSESFSSTASPHQLLGRPLTPFPGFASPGADYCFAAPA